MFSFSKLSKLRKVGYIVLFLAGIAGGFFIMRRCQENCFLPSNNTEIVSKQEHKMQEEQASFRNIVAKGPEQFAKPCKINSDCVKVNLPPCGCNAGGRATAILKSKQSAFLEYSNRHSPKVMCIQQISNHPTCRKDAVAACINDRCVLIKTSTK